MMGGCGPHSIPNLPQWAFTMWLISMAAFAGPDENLVAPNVNLTPRQVVTIQLEALQRNDEPHDDAGIEQTWVLAHPLNQRQTGPFSRFADMLKSPPYRALLKHRSHSIEVAESSPEQVIFLITIAGASGSAVGYEWMVEKVASGEHAGCWMTTSVSMPVPLGDVI
jgi:hypothetical protein